MRDIRFKWNGGFKSVGISNEVQLPHFRVLGHRQRATEINLSTGRLTRPNHHTRDLYANNISVTTTLYDDYDNY